MNRFFKIISIFLILCKHAVADEINLEYLRDYIGILKEVKKNYVRDISDKELIQYSLSGLFNSLDPHSTFFNEKEFEDMHARNKGEFGGVGIEMIYDNGLKVISPIDDSPASAAGIKAGDVIIAVDEALVSEMSYSEVLTKMRGEKGTKIKLTIIREGEAEPLEVTLIRDIIKARSIKEHLYGDIGYLRITSFTDGTTENLIRAIISLKKKSNNALKGIVLDLRNNPGGLLYESIGVASIFVDKNATIVSTRAKNGKDTKIFRAKENNFTLGNISLVILVNGGSASASEIVAGAVQDYKKGIILGTKSFGKGSVQTVYPIKNLGGFSMTTALYYTPAGRSIQAQGIMPDIEVKQSQVKLVELKPLSKSESSLKGHIENKTKSHSTEILVKDDKFWQKLYEEDYQLTRALDLLTAAEIFNKK